MDSTMIRDGRNLFTQTRVEFLSIFLDAAARDELSVVVLYSFFPPLNLLLLPIWHRLSDVLLSPSLQLSLQFLSHVTASPCQ